MGDLCKMKKNILYLVILIAVGSAAWWTYQRNQRRNTLEKLDINFAVPDTASITKVVVTSSFNKKMVLERQPQGPWKLNDEYQVAPVLMDLMLTTIHNMEMMRPLARPERKTVLEAMKTRYRKIEIYVAGELYKTLIMGDDGPHNLGTYIKLEDGDPYVVHLRGFNSFLSPRFDVSVSQWRYKLLFSSTPATLQAITVKYPGKPASDFKIRMQNKDFEIEGASRLDTSAAASYILRFKKVFVERFFDTTDPHFADSILHQTPEWTLEVEDIDKTRSHVLQLYRTPSEERTIGYLPRSKEFVTIQNQNILPLKAERRQFVKE